MKKLILFLLFSIVGFAQVPQGMSHRGTAYNSNGTILQNTPIIINVSILNGNGGTAAYTETHNLTTNNNGQYNINIGQGTNPSALFSTIDWSSGDKWLEIKIAPATNPTNFVIGTSQLMSVPYALYAGKTNSIATVEKISELRSQNLHTTGNLVYVKGYWYAGDGGGGYFSYDANNSQNDNDGTIFKPATVTGNGRWIRQYDGFINARFFGIVKGFELPYSGFSNSDQIQKAINYASKYNIYSEERGALTLFFPNGTYLIDKKIILKDRVKLLGEPGTMFVLAKNIDFYNNYSDDYMFELDNGIVDDLYIENFTVNLNDLPNIGGFHIKPALAINGVRGGLSNSGFKNINILNLYGNGIYLEGGTLASNYMLPNQVIIFENVRAVRKNDAANGLKINGQQGQLTFINCGFDGIRNKGVNVSIAKKASEPDLNSAVISFINCTFQDSEYGVDLSDVESVTLDNCWFENLDIAVQVKKSKGVNILNSHFANAAGFGSGNGSLIPQGTGRCIDVENSSVSIERNYTTVSNPNSNSIQGEKFVLGIGNDNIINLSDNQFQDIRLSETFGVMQTTTIVSNALNTSGKKLVFINGPVTSNQINRIDSTIGAGETIFIRANTGGTIIFNTMGSVAGRNIHLNGRTSLTLLNGQAATFIKIDNIVGNEKCTYQLVSISN